MLLQCFRIILCLDTKWNVLQRVMLCLFWKLIVLDIVAFPSLHGVQNEFKVPYVLHFSIHLFNLYFLSTFNIWSWVDFLWLHKLFAVSSSSGVIYTTDTLDRETKDSYWLTVYASDRGVVPQFSTTEVFIEVDDVNDNAPLTSEPLFRCSVPENSPRDVSVIQIHAQDPDVSPPSTADWLSYRIVSGNPQNFFTINSHTGESFSVSRSYKLNLWEWLARAEKGFEW